MRFLNAVKESQAFFLSPERRVTGPRRDHLEDDARLSEAGEVAELVARFSRAELDEHALGRTVGRGVVKPLGAQLRKSISRDGDALRETLRDAIEAAIARTYVATIGIEQANGAKVAPGRSQAELWDYWLPRIYTGYLTKAAAIAATDLEAARNLGVEALGNKLDGLSLGRKGRGRRMELIGIGYANAGVVLRLSQSSMTPDDWLREPPTSHLLEFGENMWPMADFPP